MTTAEKPFLGKRFNSERFFISNEALSAGNSPALRRQEKGSASAKFEALPPNKARETKSLATGGQRRQNLLPLHIGHHLAETEALR